MKKPGAVCSKCFVLAILPLLPSCVSTIAKAVRPLTENSSIPVWKVDVTSRASPYSGTWTTRLNSANVSGAANATSTSRTYLDVREGNWTLTFDRLDAPSTEKLTKATADEVVVWKRDIHLAYELTEYLLADTPPAVDGKIYLLSPLRPYVSTWTTSSESAIPIRYAFYYAEDTDPQVSAEVKAAQRSEGLAALG